MSTSPGISDTQAPLKTTSTLSTPILNNATKARTNPTLTMPLLTALSMLPYELRIVIVFKAFDLESRRPMSWYIGLATRLIQASLVFETDLYYVLQDAMRLQPRCDLAPEGKRIVKATWLIRKLGLEGRKE